MAFDSLIAAAREAAGASYSPYSRFRVGAALECTDGKIYSGTNVENRSFGLTICAERSAITAAVSAGRRDFSALVVVCLDAAAPVSPCGACRQVLSEFVPPEFPIVFVDGSGKRVRTSMGRLFPHDALHDLADRTPG